MLNEKMYKKEIVRMWDSVRDDKYKGRNNCEGVICSECQFCDINDNDNDCYEPINAVEMVEAVEKWSKEHPQKHKISQLEYDILKFNYYNNATSRFFCDDKFLMSLLKEGYFKGADERDVVNCYFLDCEVVD